MIKRGKIIRELLQDNNLYLPFIRELEKRGFDYSFAPPPFYFKFQNVIYPKFIRILARILLRGRFLW